MAINILTSSTGAGNQVTPANNTAHLLLEGETIISTGGIGITSTVATGIDLSIAGTVIGESGISLQTTTGSGNSITVQSTGTVIGNAFAAVFNEGDNSVTRNFGQITGLGSTAMTQGFGANSLIENFGQMTSTSTGGHGVISLDTLNGAPSNVTIRNFGEMSSADQSAATIDTTPATGTTNLFNSGLISSPNIGVKDGAAAMRFVNSGTVLGDVDMGGGANIFRNSGDMVGDFLSEGGADLVANTGLIDGDVSLGGGADFYRGFGGTVTGTINGEAGDDTFLVDQIGVLINGGADFDKVLARVDFASAGGIERIVLQGADNINGTGDAEANIILGNIGDNELSGLTGNDTLLAGDGDDVLLGGDDADILRGGKGNDVLAGGSGRDELFGGLGADVFLFDAITDSGIGGANRDRIKDFQSGVDIIDLSELSDPAFSFEGTGPLSGTGPSIFYSVLAGGHSLVHIDVDGDGMQDMQVLVLDTAALTAGDFLL